MSRTYAESSRPKVALVQRFVPHYNLTFYQKLVASSRYDWEFLFDDHPEQGESGLSVAAASVLPTRPIRNRRIGPALWQHGVTRWLRRGQYRAVVFELGWQILSNPWLVREAHRSGAAAIPWTKGIAENGRARAPWRQWLERRFIHRCDAVLAYGQVSSKYYQNYDYPASRIFIAQNTLDVKAITASVAHDRLKTPGLRNALKLSNHPIIGHLGRLVPQKRVDLILEALAEVRRRGLMIQLVIAGTGPEEENLQILTRKLGLESAVRFCGRIPENEVGAYFQLFDVFVSAYCAGLAIMEAMAHGIVTLTTPEARPETEFVVDGQTGFITTDFSAASIADGMFRAIRSIEQGQAIGRKAQEMVLQQATMEKMVETFDQAIDYSLQHRNQ